MEKSTAEKLRLVVLGGGPARSWRILTFNTAFPFSFSSELNWRDNMTISKEKKKN